jgi:hypothetical protein
MIIAYYMNFFNKYFLVFYFKYKNYNKLLIKFEFIYKLNLIKHVINKIKVIFGTDCVFCFLRLNGGKGGFFFFSFPWL